jgi:hypothetical protein
MLCRAPVDEHAKRAVAIDEPDRRRVHVAAGIEHCVDGDLRPAKKGVAASVVERQTF